ncbi:Serine_threonine-protein kinase PknD [Nocardiopsis dassonvillei]|uniref:WD40 repeat domain-containing serine/threonine protein kinase n=1 Tax=Nocardiopsis dassonvillei TaxID=2014 RepID=UPI003F56F254
MAPLHPTDPPEIGGYPLTARLGAGGMGQVYLARTASGRRLVVKVIRPEFAEEDGFRERFAREAEISRRVGGFHTAQVVDADPEAESPWIATAYIPGPTLEQRIRRSGAVAPPSLHVLAVGLAEGLKAIHDCDLVHRDLKPANIILAEDGPRIIDFGIARPLDADSMTTRGAVFGTLPYMSPEQTDGSRVGPASDVFSLGTVLAYAATGTSPFSGATMAETLRRLIAPPPDPGDIDPAIRDLIADCWNHDPDRRPTPDRILGRFRVRDLEGSWPPPGGAGVPALPPPPPLPTRVDRGSAAPSAPPEAGPAPEPGPRERRARRIDIAALSLIVALLLALVLWRLLPALGGDRTLDLHNTAWSMAFSPDGTAVATGGADGTARLWNTGNGNEAYEFAGHTNGLRSAAFSPDGAVLATGGSDGAIRLWNTETGEQALTLTGHEGSVRALAFSPDGTALAAGDNDGALRIWNTGTGRRDATLTDGGESMRSVAFSPDGTALAAGGSDGTARIWDVGTGEQTEELLGHRGSVMAVAFSPDGTVLVTGGSDGALRVWDLDSPGETEIPETTGRSGSGIRSIAFHPDGTVFAVGRNNGTVELRNTDDGRPVRGELTGHEGSAIALAFSPDGDRLSSGDGDGVIRFHDLE